MIVVTAPTGHIGGKVVDHLLAAGEPVRVIARDPARLPAAIRDRVAVVPGSHRDPEVVDEAFAGADAVFWLVPADPKSPDVATAYVDFARAGVASFVKHDIGHVVGISALGRGTAVVDNAGYVTATLAMDDLIAGDGVNYRALTAPSFMDNTLRAIHSIRTAGRITSLIAGDRRMPTVATRDIAAVAAGLLLDRDWRGFAEVPVLGPEDLSFDEMAGIISEVLGAPVRYERISGETLKAELTEFGLSDAMAQGMVDMAVAKDRGLDNGVPRTPRNSTPTTFRQWCEEVLRPAFAAA